MEGIPGLYGCVQEAQRLLDLADKFGGELAKKKAYFLSENHRFRCGGRRCRAASNVWLSAVFYQVAMGWPEFGASRYTEQENLWCDTKGFLNQLLEKFSNKNFFKPNKENLRDGQDCSSSCFPYAIAIYCHYVAILVEFLFFV